MTYIGYKSTKAIDIIISFRLNSVNTIYLFLKNLIFLIFCKIYQVGEFVVEVDKRVLGAVVFVYAVEG